MVSCFVWPTSQNFGLVWPQDRSVGLTWPRSKFFDLGYLGSTPKFYLLYITFWATFCKTVRPMLSVRCLSCLSVLSVSFVHCGQAVGRIKMKLGMPVGLGPGHIVLDGDPATQPPHPQRDTAPILAPCLLRPNGCMDHDVTWYEARPRLGDLVLNGDPAPHSQKGGGARRSPQIFGPCLLW